MSVKERFAEEQLKAQSLVDRLKRNEPIDLKSPGQAMVYYEMSVYVMGYTGDMPLIDRLGEIYNDPLFERMCELVNIETDLRELTDEEHREISSIEEHLTSEYGEEFFDFAFNMVLFFNLDQDTQNV